MKTFRSLFLLGVAAIVPLQAASQATTTKPEDAGISSERLKRVDELMARLQAEGKLAGAVTVVSRRGQLVSLKAHGFADLEARRAMRTDDIFQIQSMTKPVATVALLMLLEHGRLLLSDPVAKFLPEFRDMKVALEQPASPGGYELVPADRAITILDLLTHRSGFTGLPPRKSPAVALRAKALQSLPPEGDFTLDTYVKNLAASPLGAQPGTAFSYGPSTIVVGRLIEVITGKSLADALRDMVFVPLRMSDTFFHVPEEKRGRVATVYSQTPGQGLKRLAPASPSPRFLSAGGNLFSTPADYLRFCQMLLNGGRLDGATLLSRKTVELMVARQVDPIPLFFMPGQHFGLGVAVRRADGESGLIGSPGSYGWGGGYSTYFRIDPQERLILMLFTQLEFSPLDLQLQYGFHNTVMQAIVD